MAESSSSDEGPQWAKPSLPVGSVPGTYPSIMVSVLLCLVASSQSTGAPVARAVAYLLTSAGLALLEVGGSTGPLDLLQGGTAIPPLSQGHPQNKRTSHPCSCPSFGSLVLLRSSASPRMPATLSDELAHMKGWMRGTKVALQSQSALPPATGYRAAQAMQGAQTSAVGMVPSVLEPELGTTGVQAGVASYCGASSPPRLEPSSSSQATLPEWPAPMGVSWYLVLSFWKVNVEGAQLQSYDQGVMKSGTQESCQLPDRDPLGQ